MPRIVSLWSSPKLPLLILKTHGLLTKEKMSATISRYLTSNGNQRTSQRKIWWNRNWSSSTSSTTELNLIRFFSLKALIRNFTKEHSICKMISVIGHAASVQTEREKFQITNLSMMVDLWWLAWSVRGGSQMHLMGRRLYKPMLGSVRILRIWAKTRAHLNMQLFPSMQFI